MKVYNILSILAIGMFIVLYSSPAFAQFYNDSFNLTLDDGSGHPAINGIQCTQVNTEDECTVNMTCCVWDPPNPTVTYCLNDSVEVINESYSVCGGSPVLNPDVNFCQNYSNTRQEICAYGCYNSTGTCNPSPVTTALILLLIIVAVIVAVILIWRFS